MIYQILILLIIFSIIITFNILVSNKIFNELRLIDNYFLFLVLSSKYNISKYNFIGLFYIFNINKAIKYEKYRYYKCFLYSIYDNMNYISDEEKNKALEYIILYERRMKINKLIGI